MPWEGHNFEDAIILSQNLVKDDVLSSIHIEEYEVDARDTKLGKEEITRDLPNVSPDLLADLDERGIIRIGAEVRPGDILVGKVTPKGETELSAEERLLRAIFNEKSREVRDTSLKVPHGEQGTIIARQGVQRRRTATTSSARASTARRGLHRPEAQDHRGRQARRPPRQQGRHREDPAGRGHAVPRGRHAGRRHPEPARHPRPNELRPGARDPPRMDRQAGLEGRRQPGVGREAARRRPTRPPPAPRSRPRCSTARSRRRSRVCSTRRTPTATASA